MSAAHTPGPWVVSVNGRGTMLVSTPHGYIAEVFTGSPADCTLIASAPALLAALRALVAEASHGAGHVSFRNVRAARAVIAQATDTFGCLAGWMPRHEWAVIAQATDTGVQS